MMYNSSPYQEHKEVEILNSGKISEMRATIELSGETALKDRKYIRLFFKSTKIIVSLLLAIAVSLFPYLLATHYV